MRVVQNSNNIIRILKMIKINPGISRIDISRMIGLDKSTVTVVVSRLIDLGIVEESSKTLSEYQGGRKPVGLQVKENTGVILGLEIQTDYYSAVLIDLTGKVYMSSRKEFFEDGLFLDYFLKVYREIYPEIEALGKPLLGIGIATSGMIDTHNGVIIDSNPLDVHTPENFYREVKPFIQVPIFIDNDANCGCWAELAHHESSRPKDFLFVLGEFRKARIHEDNTHLLAFGIGVVIGERVHYGRDFSAGEYQSTQWKPRNKSQFSISDEDIANAPDDRSIYEMVKNELCRDIAFLVNVMNLTCVTLGGALTEYIDDMKSLIEKEIAFNWSYENKAEVCVKAASTQKETIAFGAAAMLLEHLFLTYENSAESPWKQKVGIELFNSFADTLKA